MSREPAASRYDAVVDLEPRPRGEIPRYAYALVKLTYEQRSDGRTVLAKPEPLLFDIYRDQTLVPKLPSGSDHWVQKRATDVVVCGSAYMPGGKPGPRMEVSTRIGPLAKRIAVFGRRELIWEPGGGVAIGHPEPFTEMPVIYANAYGGLDPRVPLPPEDEQQWMKLAGLGMAFDHPGLYPRNPGGRGYLVYPDPPMKGIVLPNLENPDDLLTPQRLFARKPQDWHQMPLPWSFDWTNALMYPRELYAGMDAWYPCPDPKRLPEVARGFAPPDLKKATGQAAPEFYQEASLGMVVRDKLAGIPVVVTGMHPEEKALSFTVPAEVPIEIEVEKRKLPATTLMTNLVILPAQKKFYVVYCARTGELPRSFIPEIHKDIPLSVSVAGDTPIRYQPPPTIRDRLAAAGAAGGSAAPS